MKYKKLLNQIQNEFNLSSPQKRRESLITSMRKNEESGNDCLSCSGRCCTFQANSMNMTNLEALEALVFLEENNLINEDLIRKLEECVKSFRLDNILQIGKNDFFRKTYTCPFFNFPTWGCGLGAKNKPYGCIAFNPHEKNQENGGNCHADLEIQKKRLDTFEIIEDIASDFISKKLNIFQDKSSIPVKILELLSTQK